MFIFGVPKPQPRPRAFARGRHAGVYDPGTADEWKGQIEKECRRLLDTKQINTIESPTPVWLSLVFKMPRPKRLKPTEVMVKHVSRPDIDNLTKAVMDALTAARVWDDDAQVCHQRASKLYAEDGEATGVEIALHINQP